MLAQPQQQPQQLGQSFVNENFADKFLQLDGTNDEVEKMLNSQSTDTSKPASTSVAVVVSADNSTATNVKALPQQQQVTVQQLQPPGQQMAAAQPKAQMRNPPSQHNVQSYLKLSTPVVLNHELLASYGVSINNGNNGQVNQKNLNNTVNSSGSANANSNTSNNPKVLVAGMYFLLFNYLTRVRLD